MLNWDDVKVPNALGVLEPLETVILDKAAKGVEVRVLGWAHYALNPPAWDLGKRAVRNWSGILTDQKVAFDRIASARWNAQTARLIVRLRAGAVGAGAALNVLSHPGGSSHTKLVIVGNDTTSMTAFTGGIDLTAGRYALMTHAGETNTWHDVALKIQGGLVRELLCIVQGPLATEPRESRDPVSDRWRRDFPHVAYRDGSCSFEFRDRCSPPARHTTTVAADPAGPTATSILVPDPPGYFWPDSGVFEIREAFLHAISQARQYLYFEDQYFWSEETLAALKTALQDPTRADLRVVLLTGSMQDPLDEADIKMYRDFFLWNSLVSGLTPPQLARLKFYFRWGDIGYSAARRHVIESVESLPLDPTTDLVASNFLTTVAIDADELSTRVSHSPMALCDSKSRAIRQSRRTRRSSSTSREA